MTQLDFARNGTITCQMKKAAARDAVSAQVIKKGISYGRIVLPANINHSSLASPCAIGRGLSTKVNVNIGTSQAYHNASSELQKLKISIEYKADTVMDLSTGGDLSGIREQIIANSSIPVGTVPIYEAAANAKRNRQDIADITPSDMFDIVEKQARQGVDFFTIHAGVTKAAIAVLRRSRRLTGIVSRGGAIMMKWILKNRKENPFFDDFDKLLAILKKYDVTLSLGDGLRPGSIADATDKPQLKELSILGELSRRAFKKGVQVMIEGPGHIPINQIKKNVDLEKKICKGAPFYVLGPLVTDIGCGYDHITAAIGGALAASYGADFLCYVTPSEHLGLPNFQEVKEGLIASRIAAHAADLAKNIPAAKKLDFTMSKFRKQRNWRRQISLSMDPQRAQAVHSRLRTELDDVCSMCSELCPMKIS